LFDYIIGLKLITDTGGDTVMRRASHRLGPGCDLFHRTASRSTQAATRRHGTLAVPPVYTLYNRLALGPRVTEPDLIDRSRRGDPDAWEALTRLHQEPVFRLAYLLLGDPDDAQDVTQEAFVRAYYALPRFDAARPVRPWLLRIVSNLARNRRRSLGRYFAHLNRLARTADDRAAALERDDSQAVWQAVQRLKPDFQQALYLRFFLDLSEAEMAAALEVPPGTVKSRTHRALAALREVIAREFPHLQDAFKA
jgi:RNA polymerase sigma-70 factor (ECF subfamily)